MEQFFQISISKLIFKLLQGISPILHLYSFKECETLLIEEQLNSAKINQYPFFIKNKEILKANDSISILDFLSQLIIHCLKNFKSDSYLILRESFQIIQKHIKLDNSYVENKLLKGYLKSITIFFSQAGPNFINDVKLYGLINLTVEFLSCIKKDLLLVMKKEIPKFFSILEIIYFSKILNESNQSIIDKTFKEVDLNLAKEYEECFKIYQSFRTIENYFVKEKQDPLNFGLENGIKYALSLLNAYEHSIQFIGNFPVFEIFLKIILFMYNFQSCKEILGELSIIFRNLIIANNEYNIKNMIRYFTLFLKNPSKLIPEYNEKQLTNFYKFLLANSNLNQLLNYAMLYYSSEIREIFIEFLEILFLQEPKIISEELVEAQFILITFSSKYPSLQGILRIIDQNIKYGQIYKCSKEIFYKDSLIRKRATLILKELLGLESHQYEDLINEAVKIEEVKLYEWVKKSVNFTELDCENMYNILINEEMEDLTLKKSALDQLSLYLPEIIHYKKFVNEKINVFKYVILFLSSLKIESSLDKCTYPLLGFICSALKYLCGILFFYKEEENVQKFLILKNSKDALIQGKNLPEFNILIFCLKCSFSKMPQIRNYAILCVYLSSFYDLIECDFNIGSILFPNYAIQAFEHPFVTSSLIIKPTWKTELKELPKNLINKLIHPTLNVNPFNFNDIETQLRESFSLKKTQEMYNILDTFRLCLSEDVSKKLSLFLSDYSAINPLSKAEFEFMENAISAIVIILDESHSRNHQMCDELKRVVQKNIIPSLIEQGVQILNQRNYLLSITSLIVKVLKCNIQNSESNFINLNLTDRFCQYLINMIERASDIPEIQYNYYEIFSLEILHSNLKPELASIVIDFTVSRLNLITISESFKYNYIVGRCISMIVSILKMNNFEIINNKMNESKSLTWISRLIEQRDLSISLLSYEILFFLASVDFHIKHPYFLFNAIEEGISFSCIISLRTYSFKYVNLILAALSKTELELSTNHLKDIFNKLTVSGFLTKCRLLLGVSDYILNNELFKLINWLIILDYQDALSIISQLDIWILIVEILSPLKLARKREEIKISEYLKQADYTIPEDIEKEYFLMAIEALKIFISAFSRSKELITNIISSTQLLYNLFWLSEKSITTFNNWTSKNQLIIDSFNNALIVCLHYIIFPNEENKLIKLLKSQKEESENSVQGANNFIFFVDMLKISKHENTRLAILRFLSKLILTKEKEVIDLIDNPLSKFGSELLKLFSSLNDVIFKSTNFTLCDKIDCLNGLSVLLNFSKTAKREAFKEFGNNLIGLLQETFSKWRYKKITNIQSSTILKNTTKSNLKSTIFKTKGATNVVQDSSAKKSKNKHSFIEIHEDNVNDNETSRELVLCLYNVAKSLVNQSFDSIDNWPMKTQREFLEVLIFHFDQSLIDEAITLEIIKILCTFAAQSRICKDIFAQKGTNKKPFIENFFNYILNNVPINSTSILAQNVFYLLQTLSSSRDIGPIIERSKFIDQISERLEKLSKSTKKEIQECLQFLQWFFSFISIYAFSDEARKFLLHKIYLIELLLKMLHDFQNMITRDITISGLLFLRNAAFCKGFKLYFLANPSFLEILLNYSNQGLDNEIRALATSALWAFLHNHQGIKAALNKSEIINELEIYMREVMRTVELNEFNSKESIEEKTILKNYSHILKIFKG